MCNSASLDVSRLCCSLPSQVPPAHLSFFSGSCSVSPLCPCGTQLIQAPSSIPDSRAASSPKLRQSSSPSLSQTSRAASRAWKLILTLQKCILEKTHKLYWGFPSQSFFTLAGIKSWKSYKNTKKHFQLYSDSFSSALGDIFWDQPAMQLSILTHKEETQLVCCFFFFFLSN